MRPAAAAADPSNCVGGVSSPVAAYLAVGSVAAAEASSRVRLGMANPSAACDGRASAGTNGATWLAAARPLEAKGAKGAAEAGGSMPASWTGLGSAVESGDGGSVS